MQNKKKDWTAVFSIHTLFLDIYPLGGIYFTYMQNTGKKKIAHRLKIIEGQVRGLLEMIEKDTYCIDVITQTSAVKQGLSNVEDLILENHLGSCVLHQMTSGQTGKAIKEIIKVYKLKRK